MFAFIAVHHPKPEHRQDLLDGMREMRGRMAAADGFVDAGPWEDTLTDRIVGISLWDNEEAFRAAVPADVGVPSDNVAPYETRPREIFLLRRSP
jgi:heme-degrading monooxygenase HmoA